MFSCHRYQYALWKLLVTTMLSVAAAGRWMLDNHQTQPFLVSSSLWKRLEPCDRGLGSPRCRGIITRQRLCRLLVSCHGFQFFKPGVVVLQVWEGSETFGIKKHMLVQHLVPEHKFHHWSSVPFWRRFWRCTILTSNGDLVICKWCSIWYFPNPLLQREKMDQGTDADPTSHIWASMSSL